ncbi:hypothetical protein LZF95_09295 [Algoriphagus sp. AGSA1]|uniref:hypothetical protein n=1 Tax=Algoriphagus sp. AGSA1 TaxID=2907213 RepID=UPI001F48B1DC|nr:hypothetical protein [Algoriphagus sp. AGSA1]MCE7054866.1 hypothetical protein [Algoriphagus sp. AGSA1]
MKKLVFTAMLAVGFILSISVTEPSLASTPYYDTSVFMPVATICPSGMSYYTACEQWGMGCNPDECHDTVE